MSRPASYHRSWGREFVRRAPSASRLWAPGLETLAVTIDRLELGASMLTGNDAGWFRA